MTHSTKSNKDNDHDLFLSAMQEVTPIKQNNRVEKKPKKLSTKVRKSPAISEHTTELDHEMDSRTVGAFESLMYHQKGIRLQELTKLKNGDFHCHWQLDLHGQTSDVADDQIQRFIYQAWSKKARYALIIHGKGYNSETQAPVLKNLVNQRLKQMKQVLGFCSAQPKDGGTGAVYVFLKAH